MTVAEDSPSDEELADLMNESEGVDENERDYRRRRSWYTSCG